VNEDEALAMITHNETTFAHFPLRSCSDGMVHVSQLRILRLDHFVASHPNLIGQRKARGWMPKHRGLMVHIASIKWPVLPLQGRYIDLHIRCICLSCPRQPKQRVIAFTFFGFFEVPRIRLQCEAL